MVSSEQSFKGGGFEAGQFYITLDSVMLES